MQTINGILKIANGDYQNTDAVPNTIRYVASHPIENGCNGIACSSLPEDAIDDFNEIKTFYSKTDGKQVRHFIISFVYSQYATEHIYQIAWNIACYFQQAGHQAFYGIHENTDKHHCKCYHIHMIINTINFRTGKRLENTPKQKNDFMAYINSLPYLNITPANNYY